MVENRFYLVPKFKNITNRKLTIELIPIRFELSYVYFNFDNVTVKKISLKWELTH